MKSPSFKRLAIASTCAIGFWFLLYSILGGATETIEERKALEEEGYHYNGEFVITPEEYNHIKEYVANSEVAQELSVLGIDDSEVKVECNIFATKELPMLGEAEIYKAKYGGIKPVWGMAQVVPYTSAAVLWLMISFNPLASPQKENKSPAKKGRI